MGVRGIRQIGDIDLVVDAGLWVELVDRYGLQKGEIKKVALVAGVDAFCQESFEQISAQSTVQEQIDRAELIDALPFVKLEYILYFKQKSSRPKDLVDVELIKRYLAGN